MRTYFLLAAYLLLHVSVSAQQWIVEKYSYDSLLNVPYGTAINFNGGIDTLTMDIYLPQCDDPTHLSRRPIMLWIHGGSFLAGSKDDASIQSFCKSFARRGYVTATINYRLGFIADDNMWQCNYPNYGCVFAGDSAEWARAYYRAVQDGKGALRYLMNRHANFRIDTNNVFVSGESAGALTALGVGLLDTAVERPVQTFALSSLPNPNANTFTCDYNDGQVFSGSSVSRPDLGGIQGDIEPSTIHFTIKGIGNMYGAMPSNLLKYHAVNQAKPAIFSYHQPCDIIVPIDSNIIYWGLSWCLTNGYNCYAIANTNLKLYGSRAFSNWNTQQNLGYTIHDEFTTTNFPYNFLIGAGSCTDQVNNPCHAYDNRTLRETHLTNFFAPLITTNPICDTAMITHSSSIQQKVIRVYPNPTSDYLEIQGLNTQNETNTIEIRDLTGRLWYQEKCIGKETMRCSMASYPPGVYVLVVHNGTGGRTMFRIHKI